MESSIASVPKRQLKVTSQGVVALRMPPGLDAAATLSARGQSSLTLPRWPGPSHQAACVRMAKAKPRGMKTKLAMLPASTMAAIFFGSC